VRYEVAEDIQRVARRLIPANNATIVIVGDLARIRAGVEALGLGPISVMELDEVTRE
jgi:hypothetical protein